MTSELLLFRNNGDGTFASPRAVVSINVTSWSEGIQAATIADIDGDGIKDGVAVVATLDAALNHITHCNLHVVWQMEVTCR